ncbi:MAG: HNH endonuclease signature motif containing protein, partial [Bdellovibrionia bacterium]
AKLFLKLGYSSLFDYSTKALKLSEANASNFVTIARKSKSVPELKTAIADGRLTVSKARKLTPVLTKENSSHWLELAMTLPKAKLEREIAKVMPETAVRDKIRPVAESRMELKMGLDEKTAELFERAQDLVSQKNSSAATYEDTLKELLKFYIDRNDPIEKAKRNHGKHDANASVPGQKQPRHSLAQQPQDRKILIPSEGKILKPHSAKNRLRMPLDAKIRHAVNVRDGGRCVVKDPSGNRCDSRRWIEIHHKVPVHLGGRNELENLETLCHAHHRAIHLN